MRLAERQQEFAMALLNPAAAAPAGIVGPDGLASNKRFAVYRNNVVAGLIEALEANFPATCRLVGEEFFRAMAHVYVIQQPPTSPILLDYGAGFPDFVSGFEPAEPLPYLSDVSRIERAWTEAYHAPDVHALNADALTSLPHNEIPDVLLDLHPSLHVVRSKFPALTIWRMNVANGIPAPVDLDAGGEDILVVRPAADVEVRSLPPGGAELVSRLAGGLTLMEAAKGGLAASASFDLAINLAALIEAGAFIRVNLVDSRSGGTASRFMSRSHAP